MSSTGAGVCVLIFCFSFFYFDLSFDPSAKKKKNDAIVLDDFSFARLGDAHSIVLNRSTTNMNTQKTSKIRIHQHCLSLSIIKKKEHFPCVWNDQCR
jgi:hypothetical protein